VAKVIVNFEEAAERAIFCENAGEALANLLVRRHEHADGQSLPYISRPAEHVDDHLDTGQEVVRRQVLDVGLREESGHLAVETGILRRGSDLRGLE
jgi:hypothetical protein